MDFQKEKDFVVKNNKDLLKIKNYLKEHQKEKKEIYLKEHQKEKKENYLKEHLKEKAENYLKKHLKEKKIKDQDEEEDLKDKKEKK